MGGADDVSSRLGITAHVSLIAQIHPSDRESALPIGANGRLEGDDPDLGHHGMYASLGYEDLEDLFPWVQLKSAGTEGQSRRSGLGFE